jgi:hypothetical protein
MGILLVVLVVLALIAVTIPVWKSYESELRGNPSSRSTNDSAEGILLSDAGDPGPVGHTSASHSPHPADLTCEDAHHPADCEIGHGGFDGGGHH